MDWTEFYQNAQAVSACVGVFVIRFLVYFGSVYVSSSLLRVQCRPTFIAPFDIKCLRHFSHHFCVNETCFGRRADIHFL